MAENLRILGISGSLRQGSYNTGALRAAVELAPEGVEIEIFDISGFPGFSQDEEQNPPEKVTDKMYNAQLAKENAAAAEKKMQEVVVKTIAKDPGFTTNKVANPRAIRSS